MNKVFLVGRLARDPEVRYTASNLATMRCAIAVDRSFVRDGDTQTADFINIIAFGNRAETMHKFLTKGSQIAIDGRIQTGSYDGQDGKKVYTTDVVVDNFQFLDSKGSRNQGETQAAGFSPEVDNSSSYTAPQEETSSSPESDPFADFGAKIELSDNDLPF